jgi:hypothetical protein
VIHFDHFLHSPQFDRNLENTRIDISAIMGEKRQHKYGSSSLDRVVASKKSKVAAPLKSL